MMRWLGAFVSFAAIWLSHVPAQAACISLIRGPLVIDVKSCKAIVPEKDLTYGDEAFRDVKGLDPKAKGKLFATYRGLLISGEVVKSTAIQSGLDVQGALNGTTADFYVAPGANNCAAIQGKRIASDIDEVCCEGNADAPCMLKTSYMLKTAKLVGVAESSAGDRTRKEVEKNPRYQAALKLFQGKKYKKAAKEFEAVLKDMTLDIRGNFLLASSYHKQELCQKALPPLEYIAEQAEAKKIWGDEEGIARQAIFLLARCYAKTGDAGKSVIILNTYLIEAGKYRSEIEKSLKLAEFGYIHTTKEYKEYKEQAKKIVGN
jgi:hypothetical protein